MACATPGRSDASPRGPASGAAMSRRPRVPSSVPSIWPWVALACALLHLGLAARTAWLQTPTIDEFAHLPAGLAHWKLHRLDLYAKSPPLWRLWLAAPVAADARTVVPPLDAPPAVVRSDPSTPPNCSTYADSSTR